MLLLKDIKKTYEIKGGQSVEALKGISLSFDNAGFISILGPSGCGKTTLLNIIGGLDRYTSGDLIIDNQTTSDYKDADWDLYRNEKIGIVFQTYNLISQLSVLHNVALSLRLNGVSAKEREERAKKALISVGLESQINKMPNQLSGGQMQRVAIARALVNEPNIILADEPTGALDSTTSIQVMDILAEIAKDKLVIMVTHNDDIAKKYSTRIIKLSDGLITSDTGDKKVLKEKKKEKETKSDSSTGKKHTVMTYPSAIALSGKNLLSKKGKTIVTSIAASFGIIGIGLVLALSNGFKNYISREERQALNTFPITIEKYATTVDEEKVVNSERYPTTETIGVVEPITSSLHINNINDDYIRYLEALNTPKKEYATIRYNYSIGMNVISSYKSGSNVIYKSIDTTPMSFLENMVNNISSSYGSTTSMWQPLPASSKEILDQYDIINPNGELPSDTYNYQNDEIGLVLVVNSRNNLTTTTMEALGLDPTPNKTYTFNDVLNMEYRYIPASDFYTSQNTKTEEKIGLFLKPDAKLNDLSNLVSSSNADNINLSTLLSYVDLPNMNSQDFASTFFSVASNYTTEFNTYTQLDLTSAEKVLETIQKLSSGLTLKKFREEFLKQEALDEKNEREAFSSFMINFFTDFAHHDSMRPFFTRTLKSYNTPDSAQLANLYNGTKGKKLKVKAILREKKGISLGILHTGIYYPRPLTYQAFIDCKSDETGTIANSFKNHAFIGYTYNDSESHSSNTDRNASLVGAISDTIDSLYQSNDPDKDSSNIFGHLFNESAIYLNFREIIDSLKNISWDKYLSRYNYLGSDVALRQGEDFNNIYTYSKYVSSITIYPLSFEDKTYIAEYLNKYNEGKKPSEQIILTDIGQAATEIIGQIVSVISGVLIAFASISLVVSSIMIAILIYSSVIERTKEIGILRSIGARKKDVGRLFHAEGMIIGFLSGSLGVIITYLISIPLSLILNAAFPTAELGMIAFLNPLHGLVLILISILLTFLASLIPSKYAANKDPVLCLRTE